MTKAKKSERPPLSLLDLTVPAPVPSALDWNDEGVVLREKAIPEYLMQPYEQVWLNHNSTRLGGWPDPIPYMRHVELLDLLSFNGIHRELERLIGESCGVHLNLTGWRSTERDWHQDTYLNPPHVGDYYVAIWISLEDIKLNSGPFQYVPGSHRWPVVTREKILQALEPSERDYRWPKYSERLLSPLYTAEIAARNATITTHLPKRGDILFWHSRLLHRGSVPLDRTLSRKALIAHYSGINHRSDMPPAKRHNDGWFFPIVGESNVR